MNRYILILILLSIVLLFSQLIVISSTGNTDQPEYQVLEKFENFEIREYPSLFVAKTVLPTSGYDGNSGEGFRKIAGFIFGGNDENKKIAMTSPVLMDMKDSVVMSFIMPQEINPSNVPNPNNSDVIIESRPEQTVAVLSFGGWANSKKLCEKEKYLIALLEKEGIEYEGDITYLGYNPPYQLVKRKNEITINVNYQK